MKKLMFIGLLAIAVFKNAGAQEQLTIKQQADELFERFQYFKSLPLYLKLAKKNKTSVDVLERIADCYSNLNLYENAEEFYARATADAKASKLSHYYYAEVLLRDQKFDAAKKQYQVYFNDDPKALTLKLAACDSASLWMARASVFQVKNETNFNTEFSDWGLSYEGKTAMVFASDRKADGPDIDNRTGNNWFKLYESKMNGTEVNELPVATENSGIFNDTYHIGPIAFNAAGDTAYITVTTEIPRKKLDVDKPATKSTQRLYTRRLQLVIASKKDGQWMVFDSFPYNNIQKYSIGDAALSGDGHLIYFTSDMPGGEGKTDIWYCEKRADGTWGNPVNCGKTINTKEEEAFPNIGGDGSLYYSSKGLAGMGGYDIYAAAGKKAQWSPPRNLKYPINSTSDDFYLVTRDGASGYFSSNREGGQGSDDIYSFSYGKKITVPLKIAKHIDTPAKPVNAALPVLLTTIYYDLDKSNIRPDAAVELEKLVMILKDKPALRIELSSYTDSRAPDNYNLALSQRRAKAAMAYLVKRGIAAGRLVFRYYGETHLVNDCGDDVKCTELQHQLNRRTEFKIIGGGE